jgi:hypothetical protein
MSQPLGNEQYDNQPGIGRTPDTPGQLPLDEASGVLYFMDAGNGPDFNQGQVSADHGARIGYVGLSRHCVFCEWGLA